MRRTVLVVEDESAIADVVEMYLGQAGFNVRIAANAAQARTQLDDPTLDVVLLDLMLPDADGVDLFREIRGRTLRPRDHGHREGCGSRSRSRPRARCGRLRHEAIQPS